MKEQPDKEEQEKILREYQRNNKRDFIIKALLIIIIILLLLLGFWLYRDGRGGKRVLDPVGNVDVFEIQCTRNNCSGDKSSNKDDQDSTSIPNTGGRGNRNYSSTETESANNPSSRPNRDSQSKDESVDEEGDVIISDNDITWHSVNNLRIFSNPMYDMQEVVVPESSNTYQFVIKNNTKYNIKYNISFVEDNSFQINMKYRLKKGNDYIAGNDNAWVNYNELNKSNLELASGESQIYYLDWKWVSSDNDTAAGVAQANYKLNIEIEAEQK